MLAQSRTSESDDATTLTSRESRFGGLTIAFDQRVLSPRTWTTMQSDWAQELLPGLPPGRVLELCAGAGQIGLLAVQPSLRRLLQIDLNPHAVRFARRNAEVADMGARVEVREADIASVTIDSEKFPLVIADPPYLRSEHVSAYPEDPTSAVDGGADGFALVERVIRVAADVLMEQGVCLLQVGGREQASAICDWPRDRRHGLRVTEIRHATEGAVLGLERAPDAR